MDRRITPPKRVTSPTWGPPPPCKQALRLIFQVWCLKNIFLVTCNCVIAMVMNAPSSLLLALTLAPFLKPWEVRPKAAVT